MTLRYANGDIFEAVLLSRTDTAMCLAMEGADDIVELTRIRDAWVTRDCEPVQLTFDWQRQQPQSIPAESECICSPELAGRLIHLLFAGGPDEMGPAAASLVHSVAAVGASLVV